MEDSKRKTLKPSKMNLQLLENEEPPIINNKRKNSFKLEDAPVLEDIIKPNEDININISQSANTRKNSVKRKNKQKEVENSKENSLTKNNRREPNPKRKYKKNLRKPRKYTEVGGTIKVVGKISAKLESLIQRLGQNSGMFNKSNTLKENKYVMGPRIKAALEMFNKKKEEESQLANFTGRKFKSVLLTDSEKGKKKLNQAFGKVRYIQEIDEDEYEDEEFDESENDNKNNNKNKKDNKQKKSILRKSMNRDEKNKLKNKKQKNNEKVGRVLKLSSDSEDDSEHNKLHKKSKNRNNIKENNPKSSKSETSEQSDDDNNESKTKKNKDGNTTFNFSDDKSEEENGNDGIIKRKLTKHKSGRGNFFISSKKVSPSNTSYNSYNSNNSNKKNNNSLSKDNPINLNKSNKNKSSEKDGLVIKKKFVKPIEYDTFSYKEYTVKNYHSKPLNILKEEMKNYVPSKQIDFSLIIKPKKVRNKKGVMFNVPNASSDINKRRMNHNKYGVRKSVIGTINNSSLLSFAKKYDISKYEEKLSNIKKKKSALINEKKNINNEFSKKRKRYQSILLTNDKVFNDFTKKFNKMTNNENPIQKNKITNPKTRRMSVYEILQKRGFNSSFLENLNTDSNVHQNKKLKLNAKNGFNNHSNDKSNKLEQIKEKDEDQIKETHFGVKYLVFQNQNEIKTIIKKEKLNLSISKITSIFLKAIRPNKKSKLNNDNNNVKNNSELEKLYKNNFDNDKIKIEKISLNYTVDVDKKNELKINDLSNASKESISSKSSSSKKVLNNKINNETIHKNKESEKEIKVLNNDNNKVKPRDKINLNLASIFHNDKENKKSDKEILKSVNSGSNLSETYNNKNDDIYYLSDPNQNFSWNNLTHQVRKNKRSQDYIIEEKEKKIGKVKSKKAKIKKFKSSKEEPEPDDEERRRKGNLYDYYSSKIQKKKKQCLKYENDKDNSPNSKNQKIKDNSRYEYNNYSNKKKTSLRKCKSGQDTDDIYMNQSTSKKHKGQVNPITFLSKKNDKPSLIISYRQKIMEGISNRNNNVNKKENSKNNINKSMSALRRQNENKLKLNSSIEMLKIDAIKSKMKKKLIEMDNKLIDAIFYYNGPIDISCISLKNYSQTVDDLSKRALKNGYKCSKLETNYYKLTNGVDTFFVEIVKIRNNMLYYLIVKNS